MEINPKFKKVAILAAKEAGKILEKNFKKNNEILIKRDLTPVTSVDLRANEKIIRIIKRNFPLHAILSEEGKKKMGREFTWIIDPLDGTTNYIAGFPFFSVSIALIRKKEPILSIVFNPISKEFYLAEKNKGAYLNGKRIMVNNISDLSRSTLLFNRGGDLRGGLKYLLKIVSHIRTFRSFGSGNLEICQLSAGKFEEYISCRQAIWDFIPAALVAQEAGAKITDFRGNKYDLDSKNLLVANKKIYNKLLKLIK